MISTMTTSSMATSPDPHQRFDHLLRMARFHRLGVSVSFVLILGASFTWFGGPVHARQKGALSDEDILNPKKLVFDRVVPFVDSFDGARVGTVFVSKRSILAHPTKGIFGEQCSGFCPPGTDEIDASYVYVFQKKGECVIGVRWIGWGEKLEQEVNGQLVEVGRVRFQSTATNISSIVINGVRVGPPTNQSQLEPPNGTNYKYYPRRQNSIGKSVGIILNKAVSGFLSGLLGGSAQSAVKQEKPEIYSSTNEGYITDIHYFPAQELVKMGLQGEQLVIDLPSWKPSRHVIRGNALAELRRLTTTCDAD